MLTRARRTALVAIAAVGIVFPAQASGSVARVDGSTLVLEAAAGEENSLYVTYDAEDDEFDVGDLRADMTTGAGCGAAESGGGQGCPAPGITDIRVDAGDLEDTVMITDPAGPRRAVIEGGAGKDTLYGGWGSTTINGGPDADRVSGSTVDDVLDGGTGDDIMYGRRGNDRVSGGGDNDDIFETSQFAYGVGGDVVQGGDGRDILRYQDRTADMSVSLNGQPDDGESGEGDNVASDLESIILGDGYDTVMSRDGIVQHIDCWGGAGDRLIADANDGASGCETVERPPAAPPGGDPGTSGGGGTTGGSGTTQPGDQGMEAPLLGLTGPKKTDLATALRIGLPLSGRIDSPAKIKAKAKIGAAKARRLGLGSRVIARGSREVAAGDFKLRLAVPKAVRRKLAAARKVRVKIKGAAKGAGGRTAFARTLTLKR